ncbi:MAG TPA: HD domain-containing phosphohydrolase [Armatimonadota bacterium]|jgi:putative two-component system response regulator
MDQSAIRSSRVLIVDDEEVNVALLTEILTVTGYQHVVGTSDPLQVSSLYLEIDPDLIVLDLRMPYLDGFGVMETLRPMLESDSYLPILMLTGDITPEVRLRALSAGAKDFLTKPFDPSEVVLRIANLLETRHLYQALKLQNASLEEKVAARTQELEAAYLQSLDRLALAAEYRDDTTGQHTRRVGRSSYHLARYLGLPEREAETLGRAAPLHDMGKIGIADSVLLKPGKLTPEEFEVIKTHTLIGARILSGGQSPLLLVAEEIALNHHERWDGTGYTPGLGGDQIPLSGRIVAVADAYDAITNDRPYKARRSPEQALSELEAGRCRQFDPQAVDAFVAARKEGHIA